MAKFDLNDDGVVVIIGSGAGGGTLANELCQKGIKVVVLEAGARQSSGSFINDEWKSFGQLAWLDPRSTSDADGLYLGADGMGMEPGHTILVHNGLPCTCGLLGCLEAYGSVVALIQQAKDAMALHPQSCLNELYRTNGGKLNGKIIFDCAINGDETAKAVVNQFLEYVANGIGSLINLFRPEIVLIGGGICDAGDYLMIPLNEKLPKYVFASDIIGCPPAIRATLGNAAGTIGAACLDCM